MFIHKFVPGKRGLGKSVLLLHGTGGDENGMIPLSREIAPDFSILSVRGKVSENGMNRYFRRLAEGVFDMEDLLFRANELADFVEGARRDYDLGKVYALGYSNGANIAASILLLRPKTLDGAVLLRPQVPIEPKELPDLSGRRIFISSGENDGMVPPGHPEKLAAMLEKAGAEVTLNKEPAGHGLTKTEIGKAKKWVRTL